MIIIAIFLACLIVIIVQRNLYSKKGLDSINYRSEFSTDTAFVGDDIYLYETLSNDKRLPMPYIKVSTDFKEGLCFTIITDVSDGKNRKVSESSSIQSVFVMKGHSSVRRRWRIRCIKRGVYPAPGALLIASDIFGMDMASRLSKSTEMTECGKYSRLVILPKTLDLSAEFSTESGISGDVISNHCLVSDPMLLSCSRDYTTFDPMNKINWKSTASHGKLMVNIEDKTVNLRFGIILNMNTRPIERDPTIPGDILAIEQSITVCASLIESASKRNIPIKLFANTEPSEEFNTALLNLPDEYDRSLLSESELTASKILATETVFGKDSVIGLMRALSFVEMKISVPAEAMFDHICRHIEYYSDCASLVVVSPYIDERMINAHRSVKKFGIDMIFYLTTGRNDSNGVPSDVEVYYCTY